MLWSNTSIATLDGAEKTENDVPHASDRAAQQMVGYALKQADDDAVVVVDFDETLFRSNATEQFLDQARPRWWAAMVLAVLAVLRPWRWTRGGAEAADFAARDMWRVSVLCLLVPGMRRRWQQRAEGVMRDLENRSLAEQLKESNRRIIVATYGFEFIVRPMLTGSSLPIDQCIAGPLLGMSAWRRRGKAEAVRRAIGQDTLSRAIVITDSPRDADLLDLAGRPVLARWDSEVPIRAHADVYMPLVYLSKVKRQGRHEILRQVILDDFMLVLLAYGIVNPLSVGSIVGLAAAFFAFFCVYEIGYVENDRLGHEYENNPRLSDNYFDRPELKQSAEIMPWVWAMLLTVIAAFAMHTPWLGAADQIDWDAFGRDVGLWTALLVVTRLLFATYNRLDELTRVYVFPWLQVVKTFGFLLLMPTTLAGGVFMMAQVIRRWVSYANYRTGGAEKSLPTHVVRLMAYVLLIVGVAVTQGKTDILTGWHTWVLLGWLVIRGAGHLSLSLQSIRWRGRLMLPQVANESSEQQAKQSVQG